MSHVFSDIQEQVYGMGAKINAPKDLLVVSFQPRDDGVPYVLLNEGGFIYLSAERGLEIFKRFAPSVDDLMFLILSRVVAAMATRYELDNRLEGVDSRRMYFLKKIELMSSLNPAWGQRTRQEVDEILDDFPYLDRDLGRN